MIFYHATDADGRLHLCGNQADARAINKDFDQVDIPTDKAGLQAFVQRLYDERRAPPKVEDDDNPEWTAEDFEQARPAPEVLPEVSLVREDTCTLCKRKHAAAEKLAIGQDMDAVADVIATAPTWTFNNLLQAFVERQRESLTL